MKMFTQVMLIVSAVKMFFIPLYRSTDFEVHRNWLAVTHSLSMDRWYFDETSEWTLDYPPFFAWLEYALSHVAKFFDPGMLELENLNYGSQMTVLFQRLSVIFLDFLFIVSARRVSNLVSRGKLLAFLLLMSNPGLLMIDHIHFQYNGFLFGFLLYSIESMISGSHISAAIWFAVLLNFKHIFLYVAPAYAVYLLRAYCFTVSSNDGTHTAWYSFSISNLFKLGFAVISIFCLSFGPFIDQLPQVFSRLFPFKRGLCHAYWAPNFWAVYNFADKVLQYVCKRLDINVASGTAAMTGGLVQEFDHAVLPTITPGVTFVLTALSMIPALVKLWHLGADRRYRCINFIRCLVLCATCSFVFGWHVHEKAILLIIIPLSFLSVLGEDDGKSFLVLSTVGHYSLFPLLFHRNLLPIKVLIFLTHVAIAYGNIPQLYETHYKAKYGKKRQFLSLPMLGRIESLYLYGLMVVFLYDNVLHAAWGLDKTLPFLPLMLTSVYCSIGVLYFWLTYYYYFLTFNLSKVPIFTPSTSIYEKKEK
ncbi:probable dolichyl pyrophosphate Glc1Man9GlcNAc2 alpha-1,3-glucosyltransferase [Aricia agestis]|uniref:probable dolichyl pyrophosphate Glc1Man9GlcNAc2 alpha-1,3-glucosyltransferase n=1 Tax=Aricia agestis TaxID=91739 RepID=UPI001C204883|nr:probable dolichyl pyrophosphate Glc1Man9GlcNAc2 alpha-1,3-glucosyltransferase [Aricia agestis]